MEASSWAQRSVRGDYQFAEVEFDHERLYAPFVSEGAVQITISNWSLQESM